LKIGKLIKDNILTASNGFIQRYIKLESSIEDSLYNVKIKAWVKFQKIIKTFKSLNIDTLVLGETKNTQARIETKNYSKKSNAKIFMNYFRFLHSSC